MRLSQRSRPAWRVSRGGDERGAVAILVAVSMTVLLVATAMVLDFGLIRLDRQHLKSLADSAALSGIAAGDGATGDVYTHRAVCAALDSLRTSEPFRPDSSYAGLPVGSCDPVSLALNQNVKCNPAAPAPVTYDKTVTRGGATYRVVIQSPYALSSGGWSEESLPAVSGDVSALGGCDQVGVQIFESRKPGLGSLATSSNLEFGIRSVSRASMGGEDAVSPALIILERTACSALTVGSASNGEIFVRGILQTPGSIHLDSDATGGDCGSGSNQQLIQGKHAGGVVAFGSVLPLGISGLLTSVAIARGRPSDIVYDSLDNVHATTATSPILGADKVPVAGKELVGRTPVDFRYRAGVRTAITAASTATNGWSATAPAGWTTVGCNPNALALTATPTTKLWIDCTTNAGFGANGVTLASQVYLNGFFKNGNLAMPNATRVYVRNTSSSGGTINSDAITFSNGSGFCVRAASCLSPPACSALPAATRAQVFVRQGNVSAGGGVLRLCNSTLMMLGGDSAAGCVPASDGQVPTATPCTTSPAAGSGQLDVGAQATLEWTAPNQTLDKATSADWAVQEDLAMWSESAGLFKFTGAGTMSTTGVFMIPNGNVSVGGGSSQILFNSQYISRTFATGGQGSLTMTTDPRSAVTIPSITGYLLIR